jgi:ATP-dependent helicase/nuclease subunit B
VLAAAVRQALAADPGPLAAVMHHPATEAAIVGLYGELSQVSPDTLDRLHQQGGMAALSVRLFRDVTTRLAAFYNEPDLAHAVATRPDLQSAALRLGQVVWFLPAPVTSGLERMLRALFETVPGSILVGVTGDDGADAAVVDLVRRVGATIDGRPPQAPPVGSQIISAADPDDEVRSVVRHLLALAHSGVRLDRIGVFYPAADPYVHLLVHHLGTADVPANGPAPDRLADSAAGRTLLAALALPGQQWRRDLVMALVAGAPVRDGADPVFPTSWELLSRTAGVTHGLDDWNRKLHARVDLFDRRIAAVDGPDATEAVRRLENDLADAKALLGFVQRLASRVTAVSTTSGWQASSKALTALLHHLIGPAHRRTSWPAHEQDAAERVEAALDRLALLDDIDPDPTADTVLRALIAELDVARSRAGRFGHGVTYGPIATAAGQDLDAVFLLGLSEGICPATRREDSLLSDDARELAAPELATRLSHLHDQHRAYLAALAAAPLERRIITFARSDPRRSRGHLPSRWLLHTASALTGSTVYSTEFGALGLPVVAAVDSYVGGLRAAPVLLSLAERDLAELLVVAGTGGDVLDHPATVGAVGRGISASRARRSPRFTEWDGNLATLPVPSPTSGDSPVSPTGLEDWAVCGYRYFLSRVLRVRTRDEPERIHEISAIDRGSGVHAILERFFERVIEHGAPEPAVAWSDEHRRWMREIAIDEFTRLEQLGRTGRPVGWVLEQERLLSLLDEFLTRDDAYRASRGARPLRVELPFGLDDADPVIVSLPDGRAVHFRGKADRVDRTADGEWIVIDYKTGKGDKFKSLATDPFNGGTTLQLGLYAEAARQRLGGDAASAYYWMVDEAARYQQYGYSWTADRQQRFLSIIEAMVAGIEGGVFPAVPGTWATFTNTYDSCTYCDFDDVCSRERGDHADAKVAAPELRVRDVLVAPEPDAEEPSA